MTAAQWRAKIKQQTEAVGTFRTDFNSVIDALAKILEQRDNAYTQLRDAGFPLTVEHVSDRGSVSTVKNPLLQVWNDLNTQALAYWRDLGLTPAGLKKITGDGKAPKAPTGLLAVLTDFEAG